MTHGTCSALVCLDVCGTSQGVYSPYTRLTQPVLHTVSTFLGQVILSDQFGNISVLQIKLIPAVEVLREICV